MYQNDHLFKVSSVDVRCIDGFINLNSRVGLGLRVVAYCNDLQMAVA